jgi:hypothetical protein
MSTATTTFARGIGEINEIRSQYPADDDVGKAADTAVSLVR